MIGSSRSFPPAHLRIGSSPTCETLTVNAPAVAAITAVIVLPSSLISLIRRLAAVKYARSNSIPIKRRPISIAATPVDPTPMNGSKIRSPSLLAIFNIFLRIATGFCAGCFGSLILSGTMHIGLSMKLCISFCERKFQVCPLFQQQKIISQLLRKPALNIFGAGLVLCQIIN